MSDIQNAVCSRGQRPGAGVRESRAVLQRCSACGCEELTRLALRSLAASRLHVCVCSNWRLQGACMYAISSVASFAGRLAVGVPHNSQASLSLGNAPLPNRDTNVLLSGVAHSRERLLRRLAQVGDQLILQTPQGPPPLHSIPVSPKLAIGRSVTFASDSP